MKKIKHLLLLTFLAALYACNGGNKKSIKAPIATFVKDTFDFATIKKGDTANIIFTIQNTGTEYVVIKNSSVGCGCTKVNSLKNRIAPGEVGDLTLTYDSKNDTGKVLKTVVIETNTTPKLHVLYIKGVVE